MEWGSVKQSFHKTQDQARLVFKTVFQHFSASILDILKENFIIDLGRGGGGRGFLFHVVLSEIAILNILNGTIRPPPPQIKDGKWHVYPLARLHR